MDPEQLVQRAREARADAYAPYSRYAVGAALLTKDGRVFTGVNVENSSYGLTICAERTAVTTAVTAGAREFAAIAVATDDGGSCCGACRQVLGEFGDDLIIYLAPASGPYRTTSIQELLPDMFRFPE